MSDRTGSVPLHMVQLWLQARGLMALGQMLGLLKPRRHASTNYLVHCALGELFQDQAPRPFCVEDAPTRFKHGHNGEAGQIRVLGYSSVDRRALQELAKGFAGPTVYEICEWDKCASKPMPQEFPNGMRLGFELRACPVIRKASEGPKWSKGQEVDVFLSHVWEIDDPGVEVDREEVYLDWLRQQFQRHGGAEVVSAGVNRFAIERMTRRTHGNDRETRTIQRPDVTLAGVLRVSNGKEFADLLRRGIGRHKSFGFGMLKVRRA